MRKVLKRTWAEVNLSVIQNNYKIYKEQLPKGTAIMAVVKADGYGHGAVQVAKAVEEVGCNCFAVSNIDEAIELREAGIKGEILILGYTPVDEAADLIKYDICQTLLSYDYAKDIINTGLKIRCQYAIDSGMNRIGLDAKDIKGCEEAIREAAKSLDLTGIYTHLCVADTDESSSVSFTNMQIKRFKEVAAKVADLKLPFVHCLNTAGGLWHYDSVSSQVRLGINLYGLKPDISNTLPDGITPAMEWKSVVSVLKDVGAGETIGYGRTFKTEKKMRIATVPAGYADGYSRLLSNKGYVLLHGKRAPIVGRICMDQFMIDVTDIPKTALYDEVILLGKSEKEELTADEMAKMIGTIGYEIICGIGKRVPRVYTQKGEK